MSSREIKIFVQYDSKRLQNIIKCGNQFLTKVRTFIKKSVRDGKFSEDRGTAYFKEILHIILFYGKINHPIIEPKYFFDEETFERLSSKYPDVFQKCNTHLPTRPPYTVLLELVAEIIGTRIVKDVLKCLLPLTNEMVVSHANGNKCGNVFVSTVISYSYFYDVAARRQTTDNYFGASVSCTGKKQREIMIDILCCQTWHKHISWAVCIGNTYNRKAFSFPPEVHSMAFNIYTPAQDSGPVNQHNSAPGGLEGGPIDRSLEICTTLRQCGILVPRAPCERCLKMFPDIIYYPNPQAHNDAKWEYGNCAECESLSQLLYANKQIFTGLVCENFPLGFGELINRKQERLVKNLRSLEFTLADRILFYNSLE